MPYEPRHSLSELLRRRHASLMNRLAKNPSRDLFMACTEEAASIEYWLRIAEEAERSERAGKLFAALAHSHQRYEEQLLTIMGKPR